MKKIILYGKTGKQIAMELQKIFPEIPAIPVNCKIFPDGEIKPVVPKEVIGRKTKIIYIQSTYPPSENLLEFFLTLNTLENSLKRDSEIIVFPPYFAYARQDRVDVEGAPFSLKWIADSISRTVKLIIFIDIHNPKALNLFPSAENILPTNLFYQYLKENFSHLLKNLRVVSPDKGAKRKNKILASLFTSPLSILDKRRDYFSGKINFYGIKGKIKKGENILMWDDILASGKTLLQGLKILKKKGANKIILLVTHMVSFLIKKNALSQIVDEVEAIITN